MIEDDFLFEKEIRIFGLKRSGNSAVVSFLWDHFPEGKNEILHLNNTGLSLYPIHKNKEKAYCQFDKKLRKPFKRFGKMKCIMNSVEHMPICQISEGLEDCSLFNRARDFRAYKYGKKVFSIEKYNVLVLRSFPNNLASIVKMGERQDTWRNRWRTEAFNLFYGLNGYEEISNIWIQYAKEVLGITDYISNKVPILYDELVKDEQYRKNISSMFGLEHVDSGMDFVGRVGSSFNGKKYRYNAREMDVLERWRYFLAENTYIPLDDCIDKILNPEIVSYNLAIFGIDLREMFNERSSSSLG